MAERSRIAVLISGRGSNMAALIYAARADDCPYEVALATGDKPDAPGLDLAEAEGISVVRIDGQHLLPLSNRLAYAALLNERCSQSVTRFDVPRFYLQKFAIVNHRLWQPTLSKQSLCEIIMSWSVFRTQIYGCL